MALTAAAVSQQIRQLEQHLGITLFIRAKSGVTLTEQGADYLAYVQEAFETLRVAQQHVERQRGVVARTGVDERHGIAWQQPRVHGSNVRQRKRDDKGIRHELTSVWQIQRRCATTDCMCRSRLPFRSLRV